MALKTKHNFPLFFVLILLIVLTVSLFIIPVYAVDYEWIQNAGFEEAYATAINDPSFELGDGDFIPYWSATGTVDIAPILPRTGSYAVVGFYNSSYVLWYNFTVPFSGSAIGNLSYYVNPQSASGNVNTYLFYDDDSYDSNVTLPPANNDWHLIDVTANVDDNKNIIAFSVWIANTNAHVDDFTYEVTGDGYGQNNIREDTEPWFTDWYLLNQDNFVGITSTEQHQGIYSAYLVYTPNYATCNLKQEIDFLYSANITEISLYAKTLSTTNVTIECLLYYADSTFNLFTSLSQPFNQTNDWVNINFDLTLLANGKFTRQIIFSVISGDPYVLTYIDDVSLKANVEVTVSRFEWYLMPNPMEYNYPSSFIGMTGQHYTFHGLLKDVNGTPTEDGTFKVTSNLGEQSGVILNGEFSFEIPPRSKLAEGTYEIFKIQMTVASGVYKVDILASWGYSVEIPEEYGGGEGTSAIPYAGEYARYLIAFGIVFIPTMTLAGITQQSRYIRDGGIGFIAGLILAIGIGVVTGIFPIWLIFLLSVVVAILIFARIR